MSKYQDLYDIFVDDIQTHYHYTQACLEFADKLASALGEYLDWDEDDIEYASLSDPKDSLQFIKSKRIDLGKSNKTTLEKLIYLVDDFWYFGVRLILKCRKASIAGRNKEVSFLIPLFIKQDGDRFIFKTNLQGSVFQDNQANQFFNTVSAQISQVLSQGVQKLLDQGETGELLSKTGFVIQVQELLPLELAVVSDTTDSEPQPDSAITENENLTIADSSSDTDEPVTPADNSGSNEASVTKEPVITKAARKRSPKTSKTSRAIQLD